MTTVNDVLTIAQQVMEIDRLRLLAEHWQQQAEAWRAKTHLADADYADLKADFEAAEARWQARYDELDERNSELYIDCAKRDQRIAELEAELGRSEDRRYES